MPKRADLSYQKAGVAYWTLDPVKKLAQKLAAQTAKNLEKIGEAEIRSSRGESAFVWDCGSYYRALVIEGLGTKNLVADAMAQLTGKSYYQAIAQDTVAMIVNDLVTVGARPEVVNAYFAVGNSVWFRDQKRTDNLLTGFKKACDLAGATWGGGETPTLSGIINPDTIELGGAATGVINPKSRLVTGEKLKAGDCIILIQSSGIHANGLTLARKIAARLPNGFATKLPSGRMFGEALLKPTIIYAKFINQLLTSNININYMVNITGHGWRKIMRSPQKLTYILEKIPQPQEEFLFMQKHGPITDEEAYAIFSMGAGFALFIDSADWAKVQKIAQNQKLKVYNAGYVTKGPRQIIIKPKNIVFKSETLDLRV